MKTAYEEMKAELDRRQNPTFLESLQDYYDKKTQGRPPLPNFYAEMKRRGKNLSNLQEFAKSINYLQTHKIETMEDLQEKYRSGNIKKKEEQLYKKWGKALKLLSADPGYPSLQTHEIEPLSRRYGMKVWQSYLENKTSGAMRMYWVYGPEQKDITIIGLEPHPEDKKNGAYDRISLSDL